MPHREQPPTEPYRPARYEIRVRGHVDDRWVAWFDGWTLIREANGDTRLTRGAVDQAALHGALKRVRDLGAPLLTVVRTPDRETGGTEPEHEEEPHA